ncbi:MAG: PAN/Apple domain-containing protein [Hyphomicrobiaceae bacterium]
MNFRTGLTIALSLFFTAQHSAAHAATKSNTIKTLEITAGQSRPANPLLQATQNSITLAQSMTKAEAFAASKDLNTVDGWQAYLKQYPEGFRADLARAYIKKLSKREPSNIDDDVDGNVDQSAPKQAQSKSAKPRYLRTRNAALEGHDRKRLYDRSVEECLLACSNETEFVCKSVDYYKTRNSCNLSDTTASQVGGLKRDYANNPFDYYKRVMNVRTSPPQRRERSQRSERPERPTLSRRVAEMNCEGGSIRGGECRCPKGRERVTNDDNDYSCVRSNKSRPTSPERETVSKLVCTYGYVSRGTCRCNSGRVRVKTGNRRYKCVRKKTTTRKKPWLKYKNPWTRKDCGSLIPGCIRECAKGDSNCKLNCNQMCSGA